MQQKYDILFESTQDDGCQGRVSFHVVIHVEAVICDFDLDATEAQLINCRYKSVLVRSRPDYCVRGLKFGFKDSHCVFYQIFDFNLAGDKLEHSHDNSFCNTTITIKKCPWSSSTTAPIQSSLAHNKRIHGTLHQHPHSAHC